MPNEKFFDWFFNSSAFFDVKETEKEEIWGYYDYFSDESSRLATSKGRYRRLKKYFEFWGRPARVMKIGPATGTMLHVAQQNGHEVRGCDVSSRFAEYARKNYRVEIDNGRFEKMPYEDSQFDIILLFNVIENVPNQAEFLEAINRTLAPGGFFISNYVDMKNNLVAGIQKDKYFLYRPPICYIYTREVYRRILNNFGFEIREVKWDYRHMHLEKISTLLRWKWLHTLSKSLHINRINFPIYAYPSKIVIAQKTSGIDLKS
jgi:SAM-dependent methyltransferase